MCNQVRELSSDRKRQVSYRSLIIAISFALTFEVGTGGAAGTDYLAEAESLAAKGQLKAAEIQLKNAVRSDPNNGAAHYRLAVIQLQLGNSAAAEHEARIARDGGYDPAHSGPLLAQTYLAQQKFRQVLEDFSAEQGGNAERAGIMVARGYAQVALGKPEEAQQSFKEAEKLAPDDANAVLAQAKLLIAKGQMTTAEPLLDRALALDPKASEARLGKARVLRLKGDVDQALAIIDELVTSNPGNLQARVERAEIQLARNNEDAAKADIKAVLDLQPGNTLAIYLRAAIAAKNKDFQSASLELQKISGAFSALPRGYYLQALVQYNLKQFEQAEDSARRYVARNPDLAGYKLLGAIDLALKRPADTVEALGRFESAGQADAEALDLLGRAYIQIGKISEALGAFSAAVKLAPENATLRTRLAGVQLSTGHQEEGVADLERSLKIAPSVPAAELLVLTELRAGRLQEAGDAAKKFKEAEPDSPAAGNLLGVIALARFDLETARNQFAELRAKYPDFAAAPLNLARVFELQGKFTDAEEVLEQILKQRPTDAVALERLVNLLWRDGKGDAAVSAAERAHAAAPENGGITAGLIDLYIRQNQKEKALDLARKEASANEANIVVVAARARAELAAGLKEEAVRTYRRLTELAPTNIGYQRQLAALLLSSGDNPAAQQLIDKALEIQPQNASLAEDRIAIAFKTSGVDGALAAARQLQTANPKLPNAQALEGDAYMIAGKYAEAAATYATALKQTPSTMLAVALAKAKAAAGDADGAASTLRDWTKTHPADKGVFAMLGTYDLAARRFEEAKKELETAFDTLSHDPVVLNNLAWVYQKTGDSRARSMAERAYLINPNLPQTKDTLGWVLVQQGQPQSAMGLLQEASSADPKNPEIRYHLAAALNMTGRREQAVQILTELVNAPATFDGRLEAEKLLAELSKK